MRTLAVLVALVGTLALAGPADAATRWLCQGKAGDICSPGLSTTAFSPTGDRLGVQRPRAGRREIDCFYVYPTVSDQQTDVASRRVDPEIRSIALYQAARFSQECRVFVPLYRQRTIVGLQRLTPGRSFAETPGYADIREAWRTYLRRHNHGRGVVLIGHSQGTFVLRELIAREIERDPDVRERLVSALLTGGNVTVPRGRDVGGDFKRVPACRSAGQLGCVVAYSVYDETPPPDALFGRTATAGQEVLCTNPARLRGGPARVDPGYPAEPYAPGTAIALGIALLGVTQPTASTPWISMPNSYSARCAKSGVTSYLRVRPVGGAPDFKPSPTPAWGLHLADMNIALGDLVALVRRQAAAFARRD